jgi:hypothetical protein
MKFADGLWVFGDGCLDVFNFSSEDTPAIVRVVVEGKVMAGFWKGNQSCPTRRLRNSVTNSRAMRSSGLVYYLDTSVKETFACSILRAGKVTCATRLLLPKQNCQYLLSFGGFKANRLAQRANQVA